MEIRSWRGAARIVALVAALSALACTSDEQRAIDHLEKGEAFLHDGLRTEAALEFQNAVKFSYGIGLRVLLERAAPFRVDFGWSKHGFNWSAGFGYTFCNTFRYSARIAFVCRS